ncbi:LytR/AlgR family response regulator transcription factor [Undibacterium sp. SXout11W]|uniref:LytR/AlgR family response regulator transcription factor n=1 Tax=Undibacterium TaxID=401469 RepID=UPI003BF2C827
MNSTNHNFNVTALIADDEPLLRQSLSRLLAQQWPTLKIVAQARNGREAIEQFDLLQPDICFLDIHMPGVSGIDVARRIARRAHIVFITAHTEYAIDAFKHGALDYLVKPIEHERFADTIARLQERLNSSHPASNTEQLIEQLAAQLQRPNTNAPLRWIRALVGQALCMIPVDKIDFLRSDEKYTLIAWRDETSKQCEALIRTPLKELIIQLDTTQFAQVHRAVVVNLAAISHVTRAENETAQIALKGRDEILPVSRSYLHLFKQM